MSERRRAALALLAAALAASAGAQTPPASPPVQSPVASSVSKQCESANRKVDREHKALAAAADSMTRDRRARESCTARSVCSRYDAAIADAQRLVARREVRLARFRDEASAACKAG